MGGIRVRMFGPGAFIAPRSFTRAPNAFKGMMLSAFDWAFLALTVALLFSYGHLGHLVCPSSGLF